MIAYRLDASPEKDPSACGQISGQPQLSRSEEWPRCRICDADLVSFLEVELSVAHISEFLRGSRLQVFACREHDDIAGPIYSDYAPFVTASRQFRLPNRYWEITDGHYLLRLLPPSAETVAPRRETRLAPRFLIATEVQGSAVGSSDSLQLLGEPFWIQDPEPHECSCGAPMSLLLQIPGGYAFPMADGAPPQPNSFSLNDYCLFLGNYIYVFAYSAIRKRCGRCSRTPDLLGNLQSIAIVLT